MSQASQLTWEVQEEIIANENIIDKGAKVVQDTVGDEEYIDPDGIRWVWNTVLNQINNEFEHKCLDEVVRLLKAHLIHQSTDDHDLGD